MHEINASWVAVQELAKIGLAENITLETKEIPVEYSTVKAVVPKLWSTIKPKVQYTLTATVLSRQRLAYAASAASTRCCNV